MDETTTTTTKSVRWSLKQLLLLTAILAGFLAIIAYLRFPNGLFILCSVLAFIQTAVYLVFLPRGMVVAPRLTSLVMGLLCLGCFMFVSIVTMLNCFLHLLWTIGFSRFARPERQTILFVSLLITLFSFAVGILPGYQNGQTLMQQRQSLEATDLTSRLAYESNQPSESQNTGEPNQDPAFQGLLQVYTEVSEEAYEKLSWEIERVHDRSLESFIKSSGFGVSRMGPRSLGNLFLPLRNVPFVAEDDEFEMSSMNMFSYYYNSNEKWARPSLEFGSGEIGFHNERAFDFLLPNSIGVEREGGWSGFEPHGFHWPASPHVAGNNELVLKRLELVSLLKFDTPKVYVLDHMPRMDELSEQDAPTRSLDDFEKRALEQLRNNEYFVSSEIEGKVRALGAIVTFDDCRRCHATQNGDLLGAFSYEFARRERTVEKVSE